MYKHIGFALGLVLAMLLVFASIAIAQQQIYLPQILTLGQEANLDSAGDSAGNVTGPQTEGQSQIDAQGLKTDICHRQKKGGQITGYKVLSVNENAKAAHLGHGDGLPGDAVTVPAAGILDENCNVVPPTPIPIETSTPLPPTPTDTVTPTPIPPTPTATNTFTSTPLPPTPTNTFTPTPLPPTPTPTFTVTPTPIPPTPTDTPLPS